MTTTTTRAPRSTEPAAGRFRPDVEGLRAVAVLGVPLFHADVPGVTGGYVGVDVFFGCPSGRLDERAAGIAPRETGWGCHRGYEYFHTVGIAVLASLSLEKLAGR